jgi:hypothetical protein
MTFCAVIPRHVCGPSIYGRGALAREVVPLVDAGNAAELRSLARKQLVHEDAVEAKPRQGRNAGSAEIVQTPAGIESVPPASSVRAFSIAASDPL